MRRTLPTVALVVFCAVGLRAEDTVDYKQHVEPLLVRHCYDCHAQTKQESGLRVDSLAALLEGGYSGPAIVPGDSAKSLLYLSVSGGEDATEMPYERDSLTKPQVALLRAWIDAGAIGPSVEPATKAAAVQSKLWSLAPIAQPPVPDVQDPMWVRNPIDHFVLARLQQQDLHPSGEADRSTLIRRVFLDLVGVLPSVKQVEAFLADQRSDAYERVVDRLLASPRYGERRARQWLDLARYADSNGYTIDGPRSIWKYRDWVIGALNRNVPFDQFTVEQIAGDLLPEATNEQIVATGFHRNTLKNEEGGTDKEQFRVEAIIDRVSTTGTVFLGLTMGCARCHDHKFDPLTQRDFYGLFAFFNNADEPTLTLPSPRQTAALAEFNGKVADIELQVGSRDDQLTAEFDAWETQLVAAGTSELPKEVQGVLAVERDQRTDEQRNVLVADQQSTDKQRKDLAAELAKLRKQKPAVDTTLVMRERVEPRETHILIRGDFLRPGKTVDADVPAAMPRLPQEATTPTRLDLARWLVSRDNPLTPRVVVNRLWQQRFGRGIVATENDFGTQGAPPSHPLLLDWLASQLVHGGWDTKAIDRLIVNSATYRQSSLQPRDSVARDPTNVWLSRQARLRLDAEVIRDVALSASGMLSSKLGGPSVFPPQPEGVMELAQVKRPWKPSTGEDRYRRGLYTYFWRSTPHAFLKTFDAPDANSACTSRDRSNTPLQALTLLNDEAFVECARALADRVVNEADEDDTSRLTHLFRLCLARQPQQAEQDRLLELLSQVRATSIETARDSATISDQAECEGCVATKSNDESSTSEWTTLARVVMNLDEFITRE